MVLLLQRVGIVALLVTLVGCAQADDGARDAVPSTRAAARSGLEWRSCGEIECASLAVPLDHTEPKGRKISLGLARRPADDPDPIGSLLVNPGGPGAAGIPMVEAAEQFLGPELLRRFDVVGWDPRGTGTSTSVDCLDDLDRFVALDRSPDDESEVDALVIESQRFADACERRSGDLLPHLSTTDTVHDMDRIRAALGDDELTYLGFSYGTYFGARYAEAFPDHVRALVLDGAVDPALTTEQVTREQAVGLEGELDAFLEWCDRNESECGFGSDGASAALDTLEARIERSGIPAGDRTLGPGEADIAIAWSLYSGDGGWPYLAAALEEASDGDGSTLLAIADEYVGRQSDGTYDNSEEAFYATGCLDGPSPRTVEEVRAMGARIASASPHFGVTSAWLGLPCTFWKAPATAAPHAIRAPGAPPILVLGTTGDPATPVAWAKALSRELESGRLLVYDGHGHAASGRGVPCIDDAVADYLVSLRLPAEGTVCSA